MARAYTPRVNDHVTYLNASGVPRPATITAVTSSTVVDLRVVHAGETYVAAPKQSARSNVSGVGVAVWRNTVVY